MFLLKKIRILSKKISFLLVGAIACSSVSTLQAQNKFQQFIGSAKESVAGAITSISGAASKTIKGNLSAALGKVRNLNRVAIVNQLEKQVENLGSQVGKIANCMLKGTCSSSERALFIGTSVTVLALTAAAVGVTLTVAATSKEVDSVTKATSEEIKGWGPQQIFQRLTNTIKNFKLSLASLKKGIIKRELTRGQKNFLYGTAASIAALVTIAIGVGVASYYYAEKKAQEKIGKEEEEEEEIIAAIPQEIPSGNLTDRLKALAQETKISLQEKMSPMQNYFAQQIKANSGSFLQTSAEKIKALLQEKQRLAQEALSATGAAKEQLAQSAQNAFESAQRMAQEVTQKITQGTSNLINQALEQIMQVKIALITPILKNIMDFAQRANRAWTPLKNVRIKDQLTNLMEKINEFTKNAYLVKNNLTSALSELAKRKAWIASHVRPVALGGKSTEEIQQEADREYPLAAAYDYAWENYPNVMNSINNLKISGPAIIVSSFLKRVADLLSSAASLHSTQGVIGKAIMSQKLAQSLQAISTHINQLGENMRTIGSTKPLLVEFPRSTKDAFFDAIKAYAWRGGSNLQTELYQRIDTLNEIFSRNIDPLLNTLSVKQEELQNAIKDIPNSILTRLQKQSSLDPIISAAQTPLLIARSLGDNISNIKKQINELIQTSAQALIATSQLITQIRPLVLFINQAMGGEIINVEIGNTISKISNNINAIGKELSGLNQELRESAPDIPAIESK